MTPKTQTHIFRYISISFQLFYPQSSNSNFEINISILHFISFTLGSLDWNNDKSANIYPKVFYVCLKNYFRFFSQFEILQMRSNFSLRRTKKNWNERRIQCIEFSFIIVFVVENDLWNQSIYALTHSQQLQS